MPGGSRKLIRHIFLFWIILSLVHEGYSQATISSNGSGGGDWSDTLSWSGYIIRDINDTAIIVSGDLITVDSSNTFVAGLTIEPSATVLQNNNRLSIYGNYLNNGQHIAYGNDRIYFQGVGSLIDGSGTINNTGRIRVYDGDKVFPASASLTFGPGEA